MRAITESVRACLNFGYVSIPKWETYRSREHRTLLSVIVTDYKGLVDVNTTSDTVTITIKSPQLDDAASYLARLKGATARISLIIYGKPWDHQRFDALLLHTKVKSFITRNNSDAIFSDELRCDTHAPVVLEGDDLYFACSVNLYGFTNDGVAYFVEDRYRPTLGWRWRQVGSTHDATFSQRAGPPHVLEARYCKNEGMHLLCRHSCTSSQRPMSHGSLYGRVRVAPLYTNKKYTRQKRILGNHRVWLISRASAYFF